MQAGDARPRLVVGIVVDQLRTDYIEYLRDKFGEQGFKTLLSEGVYIPDVDFKPARLDAVNSTAMLMTGAYPARTGVPAAYIPSQNGLQQSMRPALTDAAGTTLTNDSFTPAGISLTTIADELVIDSDGASQVYSVATDPQVALAIAGHSGKGAFWINNSSGNWVSSSYYGAIPSAVSNRNFRNSISQRIDTMRWTPSAQTLSLPHIAGAKTKAPFRHTFSRQDRDVYNKFLTTPMANAEVTDVAIDLIGNLNLGSTPGQTDMIGVGYTLAPFKYVAGSNSAELADSYLRLDRQLARLQEAIDRKVGHGNALIFLTSTGYFDDAVVTDKRYRLPGGDFSTKKARSLLNSYLSAKYGGGEYVQTIRDGQVYFDKRVLEQRSQDPESLISEARTFLMKMSGVADAYTYGEILGSEGDDEKALRLALDPRTAGDIVIRFTPGWDVHYDEQLPEVVKQTREAAVMSPAILVIPGVAPRTIDTPVDAVRLAPTVTGALRIRPPNGARQRSIPLSTKYHQ